MGLPLRSPSTVAEPIELRLVVAEPIAVPARRVQRARRARLAIVSALTAFALLQLLLTALLATGRVDWPDWLHTQRMRGLAQRTGPAACHPLTVVALGSSRSSFGVRGGELGRRLSMSVGRSTVVLNFATFGGGPFAESFAWHRIRQTGVRPDLVLIEVSADFLHQAPNEHAELGRHRFPVQALYWSDLDFIASHSDGNAGIRQEWLVGKLCPLSLHRTAILNDLEPRLVPSEQRLRSYRLDECGGLSDEAIATLGHFGNHAQFIANARARLANLGPHEVAREGLVELLADCRAERIPAALVLMSVGPALLRDLPSETKARVRSWVRALAGEFDATFIDAWEWFGEDAFTDAHHMTVAGAYQFTDRLAAELAGPLKEAVARKPE